MRFESTRTAVSRRFVHRAAFYSTPAQLIETTLLLVRDALDQNIPVALIASAITEHRVREELGGSAGLVHLSPPPGPLRGSGQAVAVQRARELREFTDWAGTVVVVVEHHPDRPGVHPTAWVEAEAAVNIALATLPVIQTCLYPSDATTVTTATDLAALGPDTVSRAVRWNHPELVDADGTVRVNPDVRTPKDVLAHYPVPAPPPLGPPDRELGFTEWQLIELRTAVAEATDMAGLTREQAEDFVVAVNEVASNAVEYGDRPWWLRVWRRPGQVTCEVHDNGSLAAPLPGLIPPHPNSTRGRGLWTARQLCDQLHVWSDELGTHVRLHVCQA